MNKLRSIDLFAGIGGIRLGFERAFGDDIDTVFVCEWDENAQKTYRANFDDDFAIAGDITKIDANSIPDFDILLGGFPCQPFSQAGLKKGFSDTRGTLFFEIERIIADKKPKAFLLEKNMSQEGLLKVLALAKEERAEGRQVLIVNMKKNKKFQTR